ncbi:MAG: 50S ribosomal protein L30 [Methermicoccaceae archaeon]
MIVVVRLRGTVNTKPEIRNTLRLLRLTRSNHCVLVEDNPHYRGMLQMVKDYVAFGDADIETIESLLHHRAELEGGKRLTDEYVAENTEYNSISELARAIADGEITLKDIPHMRPIFRLHPPRKGLKSIKKPYRMGGDTGKRDDINQLLSRMR